MNTNNQPSNRPARTYAVYFPENTSPGHPGYVLVNYLSVGLQGLTMLVLSLSDNKIYVRKMELVAKRKTHAIQAAEVRNYFEHPNVPALMSFYEYRLSYTSYLGDNDNDDGVKTTTMWQFCNGGTVEDFTGYIHKVRAETMAARGFPDVPPRLPEVFLWRYFDTILSILTTSHRSGIVHGDPNRRNTFLHWPNPTTALPDVFLGDWGSSLAYPWAEHPTYDLQRPFRINDLTELDARPLMELNPQAPIRQEVERWYNLWRGDLRELQSHLIEFIASAGRIVDTDHARDAVGRGEGLNGFTNALVSSFVDLADIVDRLSKEITPWVCFRLQTQLQAKVKGLATSIETEFRRSEHPENNFLRAFKAPDRDPTPATWPTPNVTIGKNIVKHPSFRTSIAFDNGQFETRRVAQSYRGRWVIVDEDLPDDTSDPTDNCNGGTPLPTQDDTVQDDQTRDSPSPTPSPQPADADAGADADADADADANTDRQQLQLAAQAAVAQYDSQLQRARRHPRRTPPNPDDSDSDADDLPPYDSPEASAHQLRRVRTGLEEVRDDMAGLNIEDDSNGNGDASNSDNSDGDDSNGNDSDGDESDSNSNDSDSNDSDSNGDHSNGDDSASLEDVRDDMAGLSIEDHSDSNDSDSSGDEDDNNGDDSSDDGDDDADAGDDSNSDVNDNDDDSDSDSDSDADGGANLDE